MSEPTLTEMEARILYTAMHSSWIPVIGSEAFKAAVNKLGIIGGGFCCRDCTNLATHPHRLGGLVCDEHRGPVPPLKPFHLPTQGTP